MESVSLATKKHSHDPVASYLPNQPTYLSMFKILYMHYLNYLGMTKLSQKPSYIDLCEHPIMSNGASKTFRGTIKRKNESICVGEWDRATWQSTWQRAVMHHD